MKHEIKTCQCEINDIDITFETIYSKPYISPGILKEIKNANVLLITVMKSIISLKKN